MRDMKIGIELELRCIKESLPRLKGSLIDNSI
jgi:hypothetical protein